MSGVPFEINKDDNLWIAAEAAPTYTFRYWMDDTTAGATRNVGTHTAATAEYTAYFLGAGAVNLTLTAYPAGTGSFQYRLAGTTVWQNYSGSPVQFNIGDDVEVEAIPLSGYSFRFWEDNDNTNARTFTITAGGASHTAYFLIDVPNRVQVTLTDSPLGGAQAFTWILPGMTASVPYASGTPFFINKSDELTIAVVAATDYTFRYWDDSSTSLTRYVGTHPFSTGAEEYIAYFLDDLNKVTLTLEASPVVAAGTFEYRLQGTPVWEAYPGTAVWFNIGDNVEVKATAGSGYSFRFWEDASSNAERTHTMSSVPSENELTAYFLGGDTVEITLTDIPSGAGIFSWQLDGMTGSVPYVSGTPFLVNTIDILTIEADEAPNYTFQYWLDDALAGMSRNVGMQLANTEYTAYFQSDISGETADLTLEALPAAVPITGVFQYRIQGAAAWNYCDAGTTLTFNINDVIEIGAIAPSGYDFMFWEDASDVPVRTYTVLGDDILTAYFLGSDVVEITLTADPSGTGTFSWQLDGMTTYIPYVPGAPFTINKDDDLWITTTAIPTYSFRFWDDASTSLPRNVGTHLLSTGTEEYTAYFLGLNRVTLTIEASPDVTPEAGTFEYRLQGMTAWVTYNSTPALWFNIGDVVEVKATAEAGYSFLFWENADDNVERTVTMAAGGAALTAYFLGGDTVVITLIDSPSGAGIFSWQLSGMTAYVPYVSGVPFEINKDDDLWIAAEAAPTYTFRYWMDDTTAGATRNVGDHSSNTTGTEDYTAYFLGTSTVDLTLTAYPAGTGTFQYRLAGTTTWYNYTGSPVPFNIGDDVEVEAIPLIGYSFRFWEDNDDTNARTFPITVGGASHTAYFLIDAPNRVQITLTDSPSGGAQEFTWTLPGMTDSVPYVSGTPFEINRNDELTITVVTASGYAFRYWDDSSTSLIRYVGTHLAGTPAEYTAYFLGSNVATLTLEASPLGAGTLEYRLQGTAVWELYPGTPVQFNVGDNIEVRTAAEPGYSFRFWEDTSTSTTRTVAMSTTGELLIAYFLGGDTVEITLTDIPSGAGIFSWQLLGMTDFVAYASGTPFEINKSDYLIIEANEATDYTFRYWLDDASAGQLRNVGTHIADTAEYKAYFLSDLYTADLTLEALPAAIPITNVFQYRIQGAAVWNYCDAGTTLTFNINDVIEIGAVAPSGYDFMFWEDASDVPVRTYTVLGDDILTAYFLGSDVVEITLTADPSGTGTFEWQLDGMTAFVPYVPGAPFTINKDDDLWITTAAAPTYSFRFWDDASTSLLRNVGTHLLSTGTEEYTAYFLGLNRVTLTLNASPDVNPAAGTFDYRLQGMTDWVAYPGAAVWFNIGDVVEVKATAEGVYTFLFWENADDNVERTVTMAAGGAVLTAYFLGSDKVEITLTDSPSGAGIFSWQLDGMTAYVPYVSGVPFEINKDDNLWIAVEAELTYTFRYWMDDTAAGATRNVGTHTAANAEYTAYFLGASSVDLTLTAYPAGTGSFQYRLAGTTTWYSYFGMPVQFNIGDDVEVNAIPLNGYGFRFWEDADGTNSRIFTIPAGGASHTAYFLINTPNRVQITLTDSPSGGAQEFTWTLPGMTTSVSYGTGPLEVNRNDELTIAVAAATDYTFRYWDDNSTSLTRYVGTHLTGTPAEYTAYFLDELNAVSLTLDADPAMAGTFEYRLQGMPVWETYPGTAVRFNIGDNVEVKAIPLPLPGYSFRFWEDASTNAERTHTMSSVPSENELTAYFLAPGAVEITLTDIPSGAGIFSWQLLGMTDSVPYVSGTPFFVNMTDILTIEVDEAQDYTFKYWLDDASAGMSRNVGMQFANTEYIAYFLCDLPGETADLTLEASPATIPATTDVFQYRIQGAAAWDYCVAGTTLTFNINDVVEIGAVAPSGYDFMFWEDASDVPVRTYTVLGDDILTAYFLGSDKVEITLTADPSGTGTFEWQLDGMTAFVPYVSGIPFEINKSDDLWITTTPAPAHSFRFWDDASTSLLRNAGTHTAATAEYTAYFLGPNRVTLTIEASPDVTPEAGTFEYRLQGMTAWVTYSSTPTLWFNIGDVVEVKATAEPGYSFQFWENADFNDERTVTMAAGGAALTAYFLGGDTVVITLIDSPSGAGSFSWQLDGMTEYVPYVSGTPFEINKDDDLFIKAEAEPTYTFRYWEDNTLTAIRHVGDHSGNTTGTEDYTAYFLGPGGVYLTLNTYHPGTGSFQYRIEGTSLWYNYIGIPVAFNIDDVVEVRTFPASGYIFQFWENADDNAERTVTMAAGGAALTAYFLSNQLGNQTLVTLTDIPSGAGIFSWSLPGMTASVPYVSGTPFRINQNDVLTIEVVAATTDYTFKYWTDDISAGMLRQVGTHPNVTAKEYTAYFLDDLNKVTLTLNAEPAMTGTFEYTLPGTEIWVPYPGTPVWFNAGDGIKVKAIPLPLPGYSFRFWEDAITNDERSVTISPGGDVLTAYFLLPGAIEITLTDIPSGAGIFSWQLNGMTAFVPYVSGTPFFVNMIDDLTIAVAEAQDYTFKYWLDNASAGMSRNVGMQFTDREYKAYFLSDLYTADLTLEASPATIPATADVFQYRIQGAAAWNYCVAGTTLTFNINDVVEIGAVAPSGYSFKFWENSSDVPVRTYTVLGDDILTAYFLGSDVVEITLTADPSAGGALSWQLDGMTVFVPYVPGAPFTINKSDDLTVHAEQAALYTFVSWENVYTTPTWIVGDHLTNVTGTETYTAYFLDAAAPYLTLEASPDVNPAAGTFEYRIQGATSWTPYTVPVQFNSGLGIEVKANAEAGYSFLFWEDTSDDPERAYTMPAGNTTLTAYFLSTNVNDQVEITLTASPSAGGTFEWQLDGMTAFIPYVSGSPFTINRTDDLTVRAIEAPGYDIRFWEDNSIDLVRHVGDHPSTTGAEEYTAYFLGPAAVSLTLVASPDDTPPAGTFEYRLLGMDTTIWFPYTAGTPVWFNVGDDIEVRTTAANGYTFRFWEDTSTNVERTFTMPAGGAVLTAYFLSPNINDRVTITLTADPSAGGAFTWWLDGMTGSFSCASGASFTINKSDDLFVEAQAETDYTFKFWMDDAAAGATRHVGDHLPNTTGVAGYTAYFLDDLNAVGLTLNANPSMTGTFEYRLQGTSAWLPYPGTAVWFNAGDNVEVKAIPLPLPGYSFRFWEDAGTNVERTHLMSSTPSDNELTAFFLMPGAIEITLTDIPSGAGIFSWTLPLMTAYVPYVSGTPFFVNMMDMLTIKVDEAQDYTFQYWLDDASAGMTRNVGMQFSNAEYKAYFLDDLNAFDLTLEVSPVTVPVTDTFRYRIQGVATWEYCDAGTTLAFNLNDIVEIEVITPSGYDFMFWENTNDIPVRTYTVLGDDTLTAYFLSTNVNDQVEITLVADPLGSGTLSWQLDGMNAFIPYVPGVPFVINKSDDLIVHAMEEAGYTFISWENVYTTPTWIVGDHITNTTGTEGYTAYFLDAAAPYLTLEASPDVNPAAGTFEYRIQGATSWTPYTVPVQFNSGLGIEVKANAEAGYSFLFWEDTSDDPERAYTMPAGNTTLTAYFLSTNVNDQVEITLTASPSAGGTFEWQLDGMTAFIPYVSGSPFTINRTDDLTVRAIEAPGYDIRFWEDNSIDLVRHVGDHPSTTGAEEYTAYFLGPAAVSLTLVASPDDTPPAGTFEYRLLGMDTTIWFPYTAGTPVWFNVGDDIEVRTTAANGYTFRFWEDTSTNVERTFTMPAGGAVLTAYFLSPNINDRVTITLTADPSAGGTFEWQLDGMTAFIPYVSGSPFTINKSDELTIEAIEATDYTFEYWADDNSTDPLRYVGDHLGNTTGTEEYTAYFLSDNAVELILKSSPPLGGTFEYRLPGTTTWVVYVGTPPEQFNVTDVIEIRVIEAAGYTFQFWEDYTTNSVRTHTMSAVPGENELTAYFLSDDPDDQVEITLTASPAGAGTFEWWLDGMTASVPYVEGVPFVINKTDILTIEAIDDTGTFMYWEDSSTSAERLVGTHVTDTKSYTAYFSGVDMVVLILESSPAAADVVFEYRVNGASSWTTYNMPVQLNPSDVVEINTYATNGYTFRFWEDSTNSNPRTYTMSSVPYTNETLTAYFLSDNPGDWVTITLTADPSAGGTFTWWLDGMTGSFPCASGASFTINKDDDLTIEADEAPLYDFLFWEDSTLTAIRNVGDHLSNTTGTEDYTAYFLDTTNAATLTLLASPDVTAGSFEYKYPAMTDWIEYLGSPVQFNIGDAVDVRTTAETGYTFRFWEDTSTSPSRTHTMSSVPGDNVLTAYFLSDNSSDWVTITLTAVPSVGGTFSWQLDGMTVSFPCASGASFVINKDDDLWIMAEEAPTHTFKFWMDDTAAIAIRHVGDHSGNTTGTEEYTAYFLSNDPDETTELTLEALPDVNPVAGTFDYRLQGMMVWIPYPGMAVTFNDTDVVEVKANAEPGYSFMFWENADDDPERTVIMSIDRDLTAYFLGGDTVEITLVAVPSAGGTFSWQLDGMTAFVPYVSGVPFEINKIDDLTIRAEEALTHTFLVWEDASTSPTRYVGDHLLNTTGTETYTAFFTSDNPAERFALELLAVPFGLGTFEYMLSGMTDWAAYTGSELFNVGDTVQVRAVGVQGYTFQYWEVITNTNPVRSFDSINNFGVAYFLADEPSGRVKVTLTDVPSGAGTFTWQVYGMPYAFEYTDTGPFYVNRFIDDLTIRARAEPDYTFKFWIDEPVTTALRDIYSFYLDDDEKEYIAYFLSDDPNDTADLTLGDNPTGSGAFKYQFDGFGMTHWYNFVGTTMTFNKTDDVIVRADAQPSFTFLFWKDADTDPVRPFDMSLGNQSDVAYFVSNAIGDWVEITLTDVPSGAGTFTWWLYGMTGTVPYVDGVPFRINKSDELFVEATAESGYDFKVWSNGTANPILNVANHSGSSGTEGYTAYFLGSNTAPLIIIPMPSGAGTFQYRYFGMTEWAAYTSGELFNVHDHIELNAVPGSDYEFRFWEDGKSGLFTIDNFDQAGETVYAYFLTNDLDGRGYVEYDIPSDIEDMVLAGDENAYFWWKLPNMTANILYNLGEPIEANLGEVVWIIGPSDLGYWADFGEGVITGPVDVTVKTTCEWISGRGSDAGTIPVIDALTLDSYAAGTGTFEYRLQGAADWLTYAAGTPEVFSAGDVIEIRTVAEPGYTLRFWEDGTDAAQRTFTMPSGGAVLTAYFLSDDPDDTAEITLTAASGEGVFSWSLPGMTAAVPYVSGVPFLINKSDDLTIEAAAEPGYVFWYWDGASANPSWHVGVPAAGDAEYAAYFLAEDAAVLTLETDPAGIGTFQYRLLGTTDWYDYAGTPVVFDAGDIVEVVSIAPVSEYPFQNGYSFLCWEDGTDAVLRTFTMPFGGAVLTATYTLGDNVLITLTADPAGAFAWSLPGMTTPIPYEGPFYIDIADEIMIYSVSVSGEYAFLCWEDGSASSFLYVGPHSDDTEYIAYFAAMFLIEVEAGEGVVSSGSFAVIEGADHTVTFSAAEGYTISAVIVDGVPLSQEDADLGSYTFCGVQNSHIIEVIAAQG
ncbi:MAG: hypothetical protein FWG96_00005 [Methanomassiliicoccaceae archaeon]|nr:hypothetical protein [Methanomassiliicoccaceae archaeon]